MRRERYIQEAVIAVLKGDTLLTTALGGDTEIRADSWPGPDWNYPCLRVVINSLSPATDGLCHLTAWNVTFSIFVFTQPTVMAGTYDASSLQCATLIFRVGGAVLGERIESSGNFVPITAINIVGQNAPVPEAPAGGWRGELLCEMRIIEI